jgi:hypothetical protein
VVQYHRCPGQNGRILANPRPERPDLGRLSEIQPILGHNCRISAVCLRSGPPPDRTSGSRPLVRDPGHPRPSVQIRPIPCHNCRTPAVCPGSRPTPTRTTGFRSSVRDLAHPRPERPDLAKPAEIRPFPDQNRGRGRGPVLDCLGCWVSGGLGC